MKVPGQRGGGGGDEPCPFSVKYSPECGHCADKGDLLDMHLQVVPESGFSEPVDVKLRIKVPDPALGIFTIYDGVQDLGTHTYPYDPMEYSLALDPDNPPEGYEFIRKAYNAAKKMNIRCVDVNILVRASGGGFVCEEKLNYKVNL